VELTVLGGSGAWPRPGQACSGYLVEHDGYRILIDPGYGVMLEVQRYCRPGDIDAVLISHGHPDHCADLTAVIRARVLGPGDHPVLPLVGPVEAIEAVLATDPIQSVIGAAEVIGADPGETVELGPFTIESAEVRHHVTTFGFRITSSDGAVLAYTADSGVSADRVDLARDAGLLIAEATYPEGTPAEDARYLSDARQVAQLALDADVDHCLLTHLLPYADPIRALALVRNAGFDAVELARPGLVHRVEPRPAAAGIPRRAAPKVITLTQATPRRAATP
jgi:ribonuclease BN (tRNA processing enzyme)